jgi:2-dehydro-3-deoxygalactonokinase
MTGAAPSPVIVDWGTTSFRAYRFAADGTREARVAPAGILSIAGGAFEETLRREAGDWLAPGVEVWLSGMITSRNGWIETPYVGLPATLADLAGGTVGRTLADGVRLRLLPGVADFGERPDIMRGEEIQVFGTVPEHGHALVILPGTHSKWVRVDEGRITGFRTMMTGEVFGALVRHTILGRLIPEATAPRPEAFRDGVSRGLAEGGGLLSDLFTARSATILGRRPADEIADFLSGLLLGHEIREGLPSRRDGRRPSVVGEPELAGRYVAALAIAGVEATAGPPDAAVAGFARLAALS